MFVPLPFHVFAEVALMAAEESGEYFSVKSLVPLRERS
jgi:hypothetical protein